MSITGTGKNEPIGLSKSHFFSEKALDFGENLSTGKPPKPSSRKSPRWLAIGVIVPAMKDAIALILTFLNLRSAEADDAFVKRCEMLARTASISVIFEDAPVATDNTRGLNELRQLSGSKASTTTYLDCPMQNPPRPSTWFRTC